MTEPPKDFAQELAKEIAAQLPVKDVYQDALSGAAKEGGYLLTDLVKVIRLALAPVQFLGAAQDRLRQFIDRSIRRIPDDRRIPPAPQILGPVLEAIRYEPAETPIDEMFSQLLSRAMDHERVNEAHPAYAIIIRQLSSDEVKILSKLRGHRYDYVYTADLDPKTRTFSGHHVEVDKLPKDDIQFPQNVGLYMEHLDKLGLAGIYQVGNQEPTYTEDGKTQIGTRSRCEYRLTRFGDYFVRACTGEARA